jgi:hypothetical protein
MYKDMKWNNFIKELPVYHKKLLFIQVLIYITDWVVVCLLH